MPSSPPEMVVPAAWMMVMPPVPVASCSAWTPSSAVPVTSALTLIVVRPAPVEMVVIPILAAVTAAF